MSTGRRRDTPRRRPVSGALTALVAELLIIGGAGVGLYVLWSSWFTDVQGVDHQTAIVDELDLPSTRVGGPEHSAGDSDIPVLQEPGQLASVFGTMQIPRFGADYLRPIGEGTDRQKVLNTVGLGHYEGAAMPGAVGNFSVAGHRVTYGKPLNRIAELQPGDPIVVRAIDKATGFDVWYVYTVTDHQIVTPDHIETIAPVPNKPGQAPSDADRWLTLTACHPMWSAAERYVVHAKLSSWMYAKDGTPKELSASPTSKGTSLSSRSSGASSRARSGSAWSRCSLSRSQSSGSSSRSSSRGLPLTCCRRPTEVSAEATYADPLPAISLGRSWVSAFLPSHKASSLLLL